MRIVWVMFHRDVQGVVESDDGTGSACPLKAEVCGLRVGGGTGTGMNMCVHKWL